MVYLPAMGDHFFRDGKQAQMPREQINFPDTFKPSQDWGGNPPKVHGEAWPEPELSVSWNKQSDYSNGNVQVSLLLPFGYAKFLARPGEDGEDPAGVGAFSPSLSRNEINRLIRTLRTARDQAYGRDE